jgi:hypothetical protein
MKNAADDNILKGVSTLDLMRKKIKPSWLPAMLIAAIPTASGGDVFGAWRLGGGGGISCENALLP